MTGNNGENIPNLRRRRIILRLIFFVMLTVFIVQVSLFTKDFLQHYELQETLDVRLLPKAEALLEQQLNTVTLPLEAITLEAIVSTNPDGLTSVCVTVDNSDGNTVGNAHDLYGDSLLVVNASQVFDAKSRGYEISGTYNSWCGQGQLRTGIHLIGFELRTSGFGSPIHFQEWAFEIR
jgi:hypothetical protein